MLSAFMNLHAFYDGYSINSSVVYRYEHFCRYLQPKCQTLISPMSDEIFSECMTEVRSY